MSATTEFCCCDLCGKPILVGETAVSLTLMKERINSHSSVEPMVANSVANWHEACAAKALGQIKGLPKYVSVV